LVSALVASALAEADAYYGYSHINAVPVHHAVSYSTPVHHAVSYAAPAVHHAVSYAAAPVHHAVSSYAAPVVHHPVGYGVSNVANTVGIHGAAPAAIPAVAGAYAGAGRYVANSAGTVHVAKREAEADAYTLGYSNLGYSHVAPVHHAVSYAAPVHHTAVSYAAPVHHAVSYAAPVHHAISSYAAPVVHHPVGYGVSNVANTVGIHGAAPAAVPAVAGAYAGAGRYVANSAGTVHVAKREAEADADALYYSSYGYRHGYRPYSLGYAHHLGYSNYGYSYPAYTYGKRSADPQTTVEATLTTIKLPNAVMYSVQH